MPLSPQSTGSRGGFTLIEMLVTIGIIVILISLLFPAITKIKTAARKADTAQELSVIANAITRYYGDFHSYPGPLPQVPLGSATLVWPSGVIQDPSNPNPTAFPAVVQAGTSSFDVTSWNAKNLTMSENLVLGLMGGLTVVQVSSVNTVEYDPSLVGQGPKELGALSGKAHAAYIDDVNLLSWRTNANGKKDGHYADVAGEANDSIIPEFVDKFPDAMPILYLRARIGATSPTPPFTNVSNGVTTFDSTNSTSNARLGQYDLSQVIAYTGAYSGTWPTLTLAPWTDITSPTGNSIGVGKVLTGKKATWAGTPFLPNPPFHGLSSVSFTGGTPTVSKGGTTYYYPYDGYAYLVDPNTSGSTSPAPRQVNAYILISPGPDRIYGTEDDITTFGDVLP